MSAPPGIARRDFGRLPAGPLVEEFTLAGAQGLRVAFITFGGIITAIHAPDRRGELADVALGFSNLAGYLGPHPYFGAIIGRVAGRIPGGVFTLDGQTRALALNDPPNHLHGGPNGFDRRCWEPCLVEQPGGRPGVTLRHRSLDGEEGYPGNVVVAVTYSVTDQNELVIEYDAVTDRATPLSLTSHSYFNLAGEGRGTIEGHWLQIHALETAATDHRMTLLGQRAPVAGQPADFTRSRRLGEALPRLLNAHGDNYFLPRARPKSLVPAARVTEPESGRVLEVLTTEDCLQFYSAACLDGSLTGKTGRPYPQFGGLCLECQGCPAAASHPGLGDIILRPGGRYHQTTIYRFSHL